MRAKGFSQIVSKNHSTKGIHFGKMFFADSTGNALEDLFPVIFNVVIPYPGFLTGLSDSGTRHFSPKT